LFENIKMDKSIETTEHIVTDLGPVNIDVVFDVHEDGVYVANNKSGHTEDGEQFQFPSQIGHVLVPVGHQVLTVVSAEREF
jgi:hypothetical protein